MHNTSKSEQLVKQSRLMIIIRWVTIWDPYILSYFSLAVIGRNIRQISQICQIFHFSLNLENLQYFFKTQAVHWFQQMYCYIMSYLDPSRQLHNHCMTLNIQCKAIAYLQMNMDLNVLYCFLKVKLYNLSNISYSILHTCSHFSY